MIKRKFLAVILVAPLAALIIGSQTSPEDKKPSVYAELFKQREGLTSLLARLEAPEKKITPFPLPPKDRTICIFMAANNNLEDYVGYNLLQMLMVGGDDYTNIVVEIHLTEKTGRPRNCFRYFVDRGFLIPIDIGGSSPKNSGSADTVIDFVTSAYTLFPAEHLDLILWDHGTGAVDPILRKSVSDLAIAGKPDFLEQLFNPFEGALKQRGPTKAACFDESSYTIINNDEIGRITREISQNVLNGNKLEILAFDACLMQTIEVASYVAAYTDYLVGSENVIGAYGWNYEIFLRRLKSRQTTGTDVATAMVEAYEEANKGGYADYTMSAIKLAKVPNVIENITRVANLLNQALTYQDPNQVSVSWILYVTRSSAAYFYDADLIDLKLMYWNLLTYYLQYLNILPGHTEIIEQLETNLTEGIGLIEDSMLINAIGSYFPGHTGGMSIYWPVTEIFSSYTKSNLYQNTGWGPFLEHYFDLV